MEPMVKVANIKKKIIAFAVSTTSFVFRYDDVGIFVYPWRLLNFRNYIKESEAYFVVLARTQDDVSKAVQFAATHKLALNVYGTGHEFQDRNAGIVPNGLLVRTLCLRTAAFDLSPDNRFGHEDGV